MTCQLEVEGGKIKENMKVKGKTCLLFFFFLIDLPLHFKVTQARCVCVPDHEIQKPSKKKLIPLKIAVHTPLLSYFLGILHIILIITKAADVFLKFL